VPTAVTSASEVLCDFSSVNYFCKHSYVLLFSAGISLTLFWRRRQR